MSKEAVLDLLNGPIYNLSWRLDYADALVKILQDKYFHHRQDNLDKDKNLQSIFLNEYEEIRVLIETVREHTWESLKEIKAAEAFDLNGAQETDSGYDESSSASLLPNVETPKKTEMPITETKNSSVVLDYMDEALHHLIRIDEAEAILEEILDYEPFDLNNEYSRRQMSKLLSAAIDIQRQAIPEAQRLIMKAMKPTEQLEADVIRDEILERASKLPIEQLRQFVDEMKNENSLTSPPIRTAM